MNTYVLASPMNNLPPDFTSAIERAFPGIGKTWLGELPGLIDAAAAKWRLTDIRPVDSLSYNFVAFALKEGKEVALKIGVPDRELLSEMAALYHFNGQGCVRLVAMDPNLHMFLVERLRPGAMLSEMKDDERTVHIACDIMERLHQSAPTGTPFIKLKEWLDGFGRLRSRFNGNTGPLPEALVQKVEELLPELYASSCPPILIHGDLHHFNILSSGEEWLAIDPKGVIGHPEYECGPFLINPWGEMTKRPDAVRITERRIAILSERLGFPRKRILDWGFCHAMLSAWWDLGPDNRTGYALEFAEMISGVKI